MPRDLNGVYALPAGNPVVPGTVISTTWANATLSDIAAALTESAVGASSAVHNEIPRFDGTSGKKLKAGLKYQTSTTDATDGALLTMGAFGIGATGTAYPSTVLNDTAPSGLYFTSTSDASSPIPGGAIVLLNIRIDTTSGVQIASRQSADRTWIRRQTAGTWSAWSEMFTATSNNVVTVDTASIGFGIGSGGSVTQVGSKSATVTLNKPAGRIMVSAASLAAGAVVYFRVNNSTVSSTDVVSIVSYQIAAYNYRIEVANIEDGAFFIRITNIYTTSLSDPFSINFVVIKGAVA